MAKLESTRTGAAAVPSVAAVDVARPLVIFYWYRLLLALLFLAWSMMTMPEGAFGSSHPQLFRLTAILYFGMVLAQGFILRSKLATRQAQGAFMVLSDIAALTLLSQASGGVGSGLGIVLAGSVAAGALLLNPRAAMALASIAAVAFIGAGALLPEPQIDSAMFLRTGLFGATFLATAAIVSLMARRARASEALAEQRGVDLANLAQLNEYIIERMDIGAMVVSASGTVRMMNEAAWYLLGLPAGRIGVELQQACPELAKRMAVWQAQRQYTSAEFTVGGNSLQARFARLGRKRDTDALVFIEDSATIKIQAQQLKLASLGRLTASIAHEIRNPLGALSHAAQLLGEDEQLNASSQRLVEIIRNHSVRMNEIIENIMRISREQPPKPKHFGLAEWLNGFVDEFAATHGIERHAVSVTLQPETIDVLFDESQLHQILSNLCENTLKYGRNDDSDHLIEIRGGTTADQPSTYLDVIDFGPGIPPEDQNKIFEPFFTTQTIGTGLGLYLTRELCESNGAKIEYVPLPTSGSCFRIRFAADRLSR